MDGFEEEEEEATTITSSSCCCSCLERLKILVNERNYRNLIHLLLQYFYEQNYHETLHSLEQESKVFFNMKYFGEIILNGDWEKAEDYLSAFTIGFDNEYSCMSFDELQTQKLRESREPSCHETASLERANLLDDLRTLVEENPNLREKLVFPRLNGSAFFNLIKRLSPNSEKNISSFKEELNFLVLQFLYEGMLKETAHRLEQESKVFFSVDYFGQLVIIGKWSEAQKYLSAFTDGDAECSKKMSYEMQKHFFLVAKDRKTKLQSKNPTSARENLLKSLKMLIDDSPTLQDKCKFPDMHEGRLLTIIKLALEWWVPYRVNLMNQIISFKDIPTLPYLCHCSAPIINNSLHDRANSQEPNGYEAGECTQLVDVHSVAGSNPIKKSVIWKLREINEPSECCTLVLPDSRLAERVVRLVYSYSGDFILALTEDAKHKLWTWQHLYEEAKVNVQPQLYQPSSGVSMINEMGASCQNQCFALNDSHLFSASGGKISVFCLNTFEKVATFGEPPPTCTYFNIFNKHIFALGCSESSILIHCLQTRKTQARLEGHQKHITCLAFSHNLNVLVSAGADAQLCVWNANGWGKVASKFLCSLSSGQVPDPPPLVKFIQFHQDQVHLLAVHERLIDTYEVPLLNLVQQWVPKESDTPITSATYSSNGQSIYVSFKSGCIKVLVSTTLDVRCQINVTAYAEPYTSLQMYPVVIAAHPSNANQIALGLSNGRVHVLEPLESEEWGESPPKRNKSG